MLPTLQVQNARELGPQFTDNMAASYGCTACSLGYSVSESRAVI